MLVGKRERNKFLHIKQTIFETLQVLSMQPHSQDVITEALVIMAFEFETHAIVACISDFNTKIGV